EKVWHRTGCKTQDWPNCIERTVEHVLLHRIRRVRPHSSDQEIEAGVSSAGLEWSELPCDVSRRFESHARKPAGCTRWHAIQGDERMVGWGDDRRGSAHTGSNQVRDLLSGGGSG